jgi:hypothetical protein
MDFSFLKNRWPMLTVGWQQAASITGQHRNQGDFLHDHSLSRPLDDDVAAADTTVAAGDG